MKNSLSPKEARIVLGLNQRQMSEAMGCHLQTWIKWERGERKINASAEQMTAALIWIQDHGQLDDFLKSRTIIF